MIFVKQLSISFSSPEQSVRCHYWRPALAAANDTDQNPELTWRTARMLNTCLYHSCQGPDVDPSASCWAPKKVDRFLCWARLVCPTLTPASDPRHLENSTRTSTPHTHVHNPLLTLVQTAHAHLYHTHVHNTSFKIAPSVAYIKAQCQRYLLIVTLCEK